ncbi:hypothetical protein [Pseudoalteromonas luteoviolacea]|uniref:Lipoprotein n=1 Tax=Pseudoalteromonas luteoviolacea H33 TaxID=1365251 RepID=A0A167C885_9GAMM|nr:hypothetical protein [Pseudoalteromonas luteoviolacea]KZN47355.1 hypothetical protein N476_23415 [Pseudoalteromonas luteoviolacea H33]KZN78853.1 hypothetical protein N477_26430 [Pseudoalteromonas luteoviolacea H33-S]MBQ4880629.1 hypothetical protein [Pseudoalteromonas luteoviolacea]MBQ4909667.1 hypothetical protein [Pseudoalteromonas luteoviolacea]
MRKFLFLVLSLTSFSSMGCSIPWPKGFTFNIEYIAHRGDRLLKNEVPIPIVETELVRGTKANSGGSCEDAGIIKLNLSLPKGSKYRLNQLGFYARVLEGEYPSNIPKTPFMVDNTGIAMFPWLDGAGEKPIDLKLEIFAINQALVIGKPVIVRIKG